MSQIVPQQNASGSPWLHLHPKLGLAPMDHLFNRLDGAYPRRWRDSFGSDQSIQNWRESWAEAFDDERITFDEVKAGLDRIRKECDWPPSLAEFLKACRETINVDAALYEARAQMANRRYGTDQWTNPAFYWAAVRIGEFDMLNASHGQLLARFGEALREVVRAGNVEPVPKRAPQYLPAPGKASAKPEAVAEELAKMRNPQQAIGSRQWAHAVIARAEKKRSDVPYMCYCMARAALGMMDMRDA